MPKYRVLVHRELIETVEIIVECANEDAADEALELIHLVEGNVVDSEIDIDSLVVDSVELIE